MKVISIIGARPQFIKAAAVSREMKAHGVDEILLHTGQHYDAKMSEVFFAELEIPAPKYNLEMGGGLHGQMTGRMLEGIEAILVNEKPDWVVVYGDTNSTLAGALAASKLHIPVAHIEAGLRSFNRNMPEETNRVLTDHVSQILFCTSEVAQLNLAKEGVTHGVTIVGDVMADAFELATGVSRLKNDSRDEEPFALLTLHRAETTDHKSFFRDVVTSVNELDYKVIFPVHPRTRNQMADLALSFGENVELIDPVGYLEMVSLLDRCSLVVTDSGGLQKEAYWAQKPCFTMRRETEWVETVEQGWNTLVGKAPLELVRKVADWKKPVKRQTLYAKGAAAKIVQQLIG